MITLFEPRRPKRRILIMSALDAIMLGVLGIAFLLLDLVFRETLQPQDVTYLRLLMISSWIVVFILETMMAYLREKE